MMVFPKKSTGFLKEFLGSFKEILRVFLVNSRIPRSFMGFLIITEVSKESLTEIHQEWFNFNNVSLTDQLLLTEGLVRGTQSQQ